MNNQSKIHVVTRALIAYEDNILLCKTLDLENNFYFLPGGHIKHEEPARVALVRELKEETGLDFSIKQFLGCLEYSFDLGQNSICHNHEYNLVFKAESFGITSTDKILCPEEHIELIWMPIANLSMVDFRPKPLCKPILEWLVGDTQKTFISEMI